MVVVVTAEEVMVVAAMAVDTLLVVMAVDISVAVMAEDVSAAVMAVDTLLAVMAVDTLLVVMAVDTLLVVMAVDTLPAVMAVHTLPAVMAVDTLLAAGSWADEAASAATPSAHRGDGIASPGTVAVVAGVVGVAVGGGWGGWVGPVFWPFLLGDVFSYALWPYEYYYPFWSYGTAYDYDYAPYVPAYRHYGYGDPSNIYGDTGATGDTRYDTHAHQTSPDVTQSCGSFAPGVTDLPIDRIRQAIDPTGEQITLVDDLATASSKASAVLNASCPNQPPLTPVARLDAVERRLEATLRAIEVIRPALARFYDSLSNEQRQRLNAIGSEVNKEGNSRNPFFCYPRRSPALRRTNAANFTVPGRARGGGR